MKPNLLYSKDIPNIEQVTLKYIYKLYYWFSNGKNGMFLDQYDSLPGSPDEIPELNDNNIINDSNNENENENDSDNNDDNNNNSNNRKKNKNNENNDDNNNEEYEYDFNHFNTAQSNKKNNSNNQSEQTNKRKRVENVIVKQNGEWLNTLENLIEVDFKLPNLTKYYNSIVKKEDEESEISIMSTNISLERINYLLSLCARPILQTNANVILEDEIFLDNLKNIYFQFFKQSQVHPTLVISKDEIIYYCQFIESLLRLSLKSFISIYGLCEEYLQDVDKRIIQINNRKKYTSTTYDRIFVKFVQNGNSMCSLVFSKVIKFKIILSTILFFISNFFLFIFIFIFVYFLNIFSVQFHQH